MSKRLKVAVYRVAKGCGLFALARKLTSRKVRVLCYHGGSFGDETCFNGLLFIRTETFSKRIQWLLEEGYQIVPLAEALNPRDRTSNGPPRVVITFDDGWYSTFKHLLPVLRDRQLPSTMYLSTKQFIRRGAVVPVAIGYLFWKANARVTTFEGIADDVDGTYDLSTVADRQRFISKLSLFVERFLVEPEEVDLKIEAVARALGVGGAALDLTSGRFHYLAQHDVQACPGMGCTVELHGHVHAYPKGRPDQLQSDLIECIRVIEGLGLPRPRHYCYPSGSFDAGGAPVMAALGIDSATTCIPGLMGEVDEHNKYLIPRFLDGENISQIEFEGEVSGFSECLRRVFRRRSR